MLLLLAFFIAGFFVNPWPIGVVIAISLSAILTFSIRNRYIGTRKRAGVAAYSKVMLSAFVGSSATFVGAMYLAFFIGKLLGLDL